MNRIRALHASGIRIHLHYFSENHSNAPRELHSFCQSVCLYEPRNKRQCSGASLPYNVAARINDLLIERLNADDHPILIEGLSCTGIIPFLKNNQRSICVRMHTNEELYYQELARSTTGLFKKFHYAAESRHIKNTRPHFLKMCCWPAFRIPIFLFSGNGGLKTYFAFPLFPTGSA